MSHKLLAFLIGLLLVSALGSYIYYRHTVAAVPVDPWTLVPNDAALVLTTDDHPTLVRHLQESQLWDNLTSVRYFQQVEDNLTLADSLVGGRDVVLRFLGRKRVLTSVHVTAPGTFDVLFQVPIATVREYRQVRALEDALRRDARYQVSMRTFHDNQLVTIQQRNTGASLTYFNYRNQLLISANPTLVEAVVLRLEHPDAPTVAADFGNTDYLTMPDTDATLLVNYRRLPQLLGVFFRPELEGDLTALTSLSRNGMLGIRLAGNKLELSGFSNPETARGSLHQRLRGQPAQRLQMAEVLSLRTALLVHMGVGPTSVLREPRPATTDSLSQLTQPLLDSLAGQFSREAALCYLAAPSARVAPGKLALAYCATPERTGILLGQLRRATGTTPSFERVGPYQIYQTGVPELPARLLGPQFANFGQPVVTQVGNYVAFGADAATLRTWLTDIAAREVWSRSPVQVAFLQATAPLARLSVLLDVRNAWNVLLRAAVEDRRAGLLRNENLFKRFPQMAFQWVPATNENDTAAQYYTQFLLRHPAIGPAVVQAQGSNSNDAVLTFKTALTSGPALVAVPGTRNAGVLVQDAAQVLHYVTPENVVAWSDSLPGPLVQPILRLRRDGNNQHLLVTPTQLHLLNERGAEVPNFPFNLPDTVQATGMVASPNQGNAATRLLVLGGDNNLFLYDTNGQPYAGWQPKRMEFSLAGEPQYLSVNGRDIIVVPLENGYVYAYDAQGGLYPGFPISMGARLHSGALVERGATLRRTRVTMVTQHGERVTFALSGEIVSRGRVATWSRNSVFRLIPDQNKASYVVVREDDRGQLAVFSPAGRQLLSRRFLTSGLKPVQYFNFGPKRQVITLTEPGPGNVYLYDADGRLISGRPFPSSAPTISLDYDATRRAYQLYRVTGPELHRTLVPW
ncbi:hypothetical protein MUN82_09415 [Hymenobacter aerilatus]|uniref:DUF3352 domain-containing protein n=1 Tax=Hymenobacter aerilatus TaxID=2932251 RepID=A0A8T9T0Z2_9BACT|nr:hypothetical protein [Hymenobacter aerilatus]UOR07301.1 hypothetical protein MUN82_09415 [Hymenobacter aerilatus]